MTNINPTRIFDLTAYQQQQYPNLPMFSFKKDNQWHQISNASFSQQVDELSKGLLALGVKPQHKVGLISENCLEWNLFDFAIQQIGAVVVAIYPNIADSDYSFIFQDAQINISIVSSAALYSRLLALQSNIPSLKKIYALQKFPDSNHFQEIIDLAHSISDETLQAAKDAVKTEDLASLIYTSGTTGKPKGVMLSHKNLIADMLSSEYSFPVGAYDRALTFLPVCHAYERTFHYVYLYKGLTIYFAQSMETIGQDMKEIKPHIFSAVPRVLEKVYEKILAKGEQLTGIKRTLFFWALKLGEQYDLTGKSAWYTFQLSIARKVIFSKWREALGGQVKGIATGSAALQEKLIRLYMAAGIPIFEGYGLTEAAPCLSVNDLRRGIKIGTVGIPLINITIKLADDGEILAKGDNIMMGYYQNPEATAEVLKDGWLHTGDIGKWVDGKYLKIIDRKKEMFKTSGGKYIVPQQMESKLVESTFIEQAMVVGEGQKFPSAFIIPTYDKLLDWAKVHAPNLISLTREEFLQQPEIAKKLDAEIAIINPQFGNWEQIKKYAILPNEFTIEDGELTPTLKMKRKFILQKYQEAYAGIYQA